MLYRSEFVQKVTVEEARKDREHFLNNMGEIILFSHFAGYLWKLEDGEVRGLHYHFIFFLDDSHKINASYDAKGFGKYWVKKITQGRGNFYSCHTSKSSYKNYGIGVINHYGSDKRVNLTGRLIEYITKISQYLKIVGAEFLVMVRWPKEKLAKMKKLLEGLANMKADKCKF